jgi:hypothetical protein
VLVLLTLARASLAAPLLLLLTAFAAEGQKGKRQPIETDFVVLSSDAYAKEYERQRPSGGFDLFQTLYESMSKPVRGVYRRAVVLDTQRIRGYLAEYQSFRGLLAPRCKPLTAGQRARGYIKGGTLLLQVGGAAKIESVMFPVGIVSTDSQSDLALLKASTSLAAVLPLRESPRIQLDEAVIAC